MSRFYVVIVLIVMALMSQQAVARGPFARFFSGQRMMRSNSPVTRSQPASEPTLFGLGIGVGSYPPYNYPRPGEFDPYRFDSYVYDPYAFGSFEAPDLLKDPYFRERHRNDSHFPGRWPPSRDYQYRVRQR
ncbi:MAG: hypothetical protein AAGG48_29010 [Planctomycetota bacterium]